MKHKALAFKQSAARAGGCGGQGWACSWHCSQWGRGGANAITLVAGGCWRSCCAHECLLALQCQQLSLHKRNSCVSSEG